MLKFWLVEFKNHLLKTVKIEFHSFSSPAVKALKSNHAKACNGGGGGGGSGENGAKKVLMHHIFLAQQ